MISAIRSAIAAACLICVSVPCAHADEGGVSFWLPGQYGSLIAAPQQPGFGLASFFLHETLDADGAVAASRQVTVGGLPSDVTLSLNADLDGELDLLFLSPSYTLPQPVWGGQLTLGAGFGYGYADISIVGDLTVRGPAGGVITGEGTISDNRSGWSDIYPSAQLRWNRGVHNYMAYAMGDIPVGMYDADRLANIGIGHAALDGGFAYTFLNPEQGVEASFATGFTYNWENDDTGYQNGLDWHAEFAASRFVSPATHIGMAGYWYQQVTDDEGGHGQLTNFKSVAIGLGPQVGHMFPVGGMQGYFNAKALVDLHAEDRPTGWSLWLTFVISPHAAQRA